MYLNYNNFLFYDSNWVSTSEQNMNILQITFKSFHTHVHTEEISIYFKKYDFHSFNSYLVGTFCSRKCCFIYTPISINNGTGARSYLTCSQF